MKLTKTYSTYFSLLQTQIKVIKIVYFEAINSLYVIYRKKKSSLFNEKRYKSKRQNRNQIVSANLQILKQIKNSDEHENREEDRELKEEIDMRVYIQSSRIQRDHYSLEQNRSKERDVNSWYTTTFKSLIESEDE